MQLGPRQRPPQVALLGSEAGADRLLGQPDLTPARAGRKRRPYSRRDFGGPVCSCASGQTAARPELGSVRPPTLSSCGTASHPPTTHPPIPKLAEASSLEGVPARTFANRSEPQRSHRAWPLSPLRGTGAPGAPGTQHGVHRETRRGESYSEAKATRKLEPEAVRRRCGLHRRAASLEEVRVSGLVLHR